MTDARIDIDYLKKKLRTLDRNALIGLREMFKDPYRIKGIKDARDGVSKEISEGWEEVREQIKVCKAAGPRTRKSGYYEGNSKLLA